MTEIILDRQVIIYIYDVENSLFPSDDLFPDEDLYPGIGALIIEAGETDCGIVSGSMKYEELIVDSNIVFGQCISNRFECEVFNISYDISGKTIYIVAKENGTQIPIFKGRVDDSTTDIYSYNRKIVAYDEFYYKRNMNVAEWWNDYWSNRDSSTLKELRDSLCEYVGLEFTERNLPNDSLVIKKDTEYTSITFTDLLKMICELQGCFPNIDRMGVLDFITLEPDSEPLEMVDKYERNTATFQSYTTATITGIQVYSDASSLSQTVGSDDNPYSISGNIFLLNMTAGEIESCCQVLLDSIKNISYKPSSIPMIVSELDILLGAKVSTESGICYIFKNEYSGSLLVEEKITCAAVGEYLEKKASSVNNEIIAGRKSSKIEQTLDGFIQQVSNDFEEVSSAFKQTAEQIQTEVTKRQNADSEMSSRIEQTAEQIQSEATRATGAESSLSSRIAQTADAITTEVENRQNADSNLSTRISQTAHSILLSASGGDNSVGIIIQLYDENGNLIDTESGTANINIVGFVTFTDLAGEGTTTINGANITTGNISCDRLSGGTINGQTFYGGKIYSDDIVCGKQFYMHPGIAASGLGVAAIPVFSIDNLNRVQFVNDVVANITGSAFSSAFSDNASYATKFGSSNRYLYFNSYNNVATSSSETWCGTTNQPFKGGYSTDGWKTTSDERVKKDFVSLIDDPRFEDMFYLLNPTEYKLIADKDGVVHVGFLAQQVKSAMDAVGIHENEFYGFYHEYTDMSEFDTEEQRIAFLERNQGNIDTYSLCYEEFIALNTHMIQKQHKEIESLKQDKLALQNRLSILEQKMEVLENVINNQNN